MKANKYTIIICVLIGVITCGTMVGIKDSNSKLFVVTVGIFTGIIVSLVSTVVVYFDKRATIYQAVKSNIADIFINLHIIHSLTGNILAQVQKICNLKELNYKLVVDLSELNISCAANMQVGTFAPLFSCGKKYRAIQDMNEFKNDLTNLKLCIGKIQSAAFEHDLLLSVVSVRPLMVDENNRLNELRALVVVQTAKVHEYQASLFQKIDKIATPFYGKEDKSWDSVKKNLFIKADSIMKQV